MRNKLYTILLLAAFFTAMLQPAIPFVRYYMSLHQEKIESIDQTCSCACNNKHDTTHPPTGDAYLKALIKRACKDKKKDSPKLPVVNISVFVKTLYSPKSPVYTCPEQNYTKISDFIILPPTSSHIEELFRPPQLS